MGSSLLLKGGTSTPKSIVETFSQANTFVAGDAVRYDIPSSTWVKAQADSAENSEVAGVVSSAASNTFDLTYSGYISVAALSGISAPVLFLDSTTAGGLTASPPSAIGTVIKPVLTKTTNDSGYIVTNYLGTQIGGSSTVAIDEIQPVGTVVPFAGSIIPDSWLECNGTSYAVSAYPYLYSKLQYSGGDRQPAYGSVCTLNMNSTSSAITSSVLVGDIVYINNRTSTASAATPTYLAHDFVAQVVGVLPNTLYIQILPKYNSTTKSFSYPNTTIAGTNETFTLFSTLTRYASLTSTTNLSAAALINASTLTHFNTPDLRGRFAIGANTAAITELETDTANNSAISVIYSLGSEGGQESTVVDTAGVLTGTANSKYTTTSSSNTGLLSNMPPYTVVRYIIKASPYTRAAIIDGIDIPYTSLLVGDLRDGSLRPSGSGEDLLFKTNDGTSGVERMRLTNAGKLSIGTTTPQHTFVVSQGNDTLEFQPGHQTDVSFIQALNRTTNSFTSTLSFRAKDYIFGSGTAQGTLITMNSSGGMNIPATTESTSLSTGGLTLGGGAGIAKNLTVGGGISAAGGITFSGLTRVTNTTASTSTAIGALTVAGGLGVAGALYVGGITTAGGITMGGALTVGGAAKINNATASTSTAIGALTVVGGVGIGGALNIGGGISAGGGITLGTAQLAVPTGTAPIFGARAYGGAVFTSASALTTVTGSKNITATYISSLQVRFTFDSATPMPNTNYVVMATGCNNTNAFNIKTLSKSTTSFIVEVVQRSDNSPVFQTGFIIDVVVFA